MAELYLNGGGDPDIIDIDDFLIAGFGARATYYKRHEIHHRATVYAGHLFSFPTSEDVFVMLLTGWTGNSGQWIRLSGDEISWDYLDSKMPAIGNNGGDKEGWVLLFKDMGIEVFN